MPNNVDRDQAGRSKPGSKKRVDPGSVEAGTVVPTPASWHRLDEALQFAEWSPSTLAGNAPPSGFYAMAMGMVGIEAGIAFQDFVKNYERQVTVEMILDDGNIEKTKDFNINDHCALIEKMDASEVFNTELTEQQCVNLANYFVSLPSEAVMKLWQALGKGETVNVTSFHKTKADNGETVSGKLVQILTGDKN